MFQRSHFHFAKRGGAVLGVVAIAWTSLAMGFASPAHAEAAPSIVIGNIDASVEGKVTATVEVRVGQFNDKPETVRFQENGVDVSAIATATPLDKTRNLLFIVVDTSDQMAQRGRLDATKAALTDFLRSKPTDLRVQLISTGNTAQRVLPKPTGDIEVLTQAVNGLKAAGPSTQASALGLAGTIAADESLVEGDVLLFSVGDTDTAAPGDKEINDSIRALNAHDLHTSVVAIAGDPEYDNRGKTVLTAYAARTSAPLIEAGTTQDIATATKDAGKYVVRQSYKADWNSTANTGEPFQKAKAFNVSALLGDADFKVNVNAGTKVAAPPFADKLPAASTIFGLPTDTARAALLIALGVGVALFALSIGLLTMNENVNLESRITTWEEWAGENGSEDGDSEKHQRTSFTDSNFLKSAVATTTKIAASRGILTGVEDKLEQAAINVRAGEAIFFTFVGSLLFAGFGFIWKGPIAAVVFLVLGILIPRAVLKFKAARRLKKFNSLLPDMLNLLSSSLRAGYSVMQALDAVSTEVEDPMGVELRRVMTEAQLGRPVNDALLDVAVRMQSPDFEWAVMAINIQREVGGNLSELLDTVGETMLERERLRREISALTAEGRVSAYILAFMPVALGVVMYVMNPDYIKTLFTSGLGQVILVVAAVSQVIGLAWMRKLVAIKL